MSDRRTQLVGEAYDAIADRYTEWSSGFEDGVRLRWREELMSRLPEGSRVLELGCGSGLRDTLVLAEHFTVTGVDISAEQIARARANVPTAVFLHADLTTLDLEYSSVDAVASFYAFNHVPRELLADVFSRVHDWLVPHGLFLTCLGVGDTPGWTGEWLGAATFFSSFPPEVNRRLVVDAGFTVELDEVSVLHEPDDDAAFHWILARR